MSDVIEAWRDRVRLAAAAAEGTAAEELIRPLVDLTDQQVRAVLYLIEVQQPSKTNQ